MKTLIYRIVFFFSVILTIFVLNACAYRHTPLKEQSYSIPSNLTDSQITKGIYQGIKNTAFWDASEIDSGFRATITKTRGKKLIIDIIVSKYEYRVFLVDAIGFNYNKEDNTIHSNYYKVVNIVTSNINDEFKKLSLDK